MQKSKVLITIILLFILTGCSSITTKSHNNQISKSEEFKNAPEWVMDPTIKDGLGAVGISDGKDKSMQEAKEEAVANGREELAKMVNVHIQDKVTTSFLKKESGEEKISQKLKEKITLQSTDVVLKNSEQRGMWISQADNVYVWMGIGGEKVDMSYREIEKYMAEKKYPITALFRSTILPGWGQFYNDEPVKGSVMIGTAVAGVLTTLYFLAERDKYRNSNSYLPEDVKNDKQKENENTDRAMIALGITASAWIFSMIDAYLNAE